MMRRLYRVETAEPRADPPDLPESRGAFGGFIGPKNLRSLVRNTAPYLFDGSAPGLPVLPATAGARLDDHARHALGWWSVLLNADDVAATPEPTAAQWTDYFALCVASHFATVATYVPTDVDTKIRDHFWFLDQPADERARMVAFTLAIGQWDVRPVSARVLDLGEHGLISGHGGERLSILAGGMLGLLRVQDAPGAESFEAAIDEELAREARAFDALAKARGRELDLLRLAAIMTHNAGDVDQGLSARGGKKEGATQRPRFARLAHEGPERYGGAFARAALLYREILAAEGHRNYPLREVRALRKDPALLLPISPFLDAWGETLALHPWRLAERAEVLAGVVAGCGKVRGQVGYFRALAGFDRVFPGGLDGADLGRHLATSTRKALRDSSLRQQVAIRRESFESSLAKRARAVLA
jgi:hypothetical protein